MLGTGGIGGQQSLLETFCHCGTQDNHERSRRFRGGTRGWYKNRFFSMVPLGDSFRGLETSSDMESIRLMFSFSLFDSYKTPSCRLSTVKVAGPLSLTLIRLMRSAFLGSFGSRFDLITHLVSFSMSCMRDTPRAAMAS